MPTGLPTRRGQGCSPGQRCIEQQTCFPHIHLALDASPPAFLHCQQDALP